MALTTPSRKKSKISMSGALIKSVSPTKAKNAISLMTIWWTLPSLPSPHARKPKILGDCNPKSRGWMQSLRQKTTITSLWSTRKIKLKTSSTIAFIVCFKLTLPTLRNPNTHKKPTLPTNPLPKESILPSESKRQNLSNPQCWSSI